MCVFMQIRSECLSCRHGVAVFDMSYFGKFYLTGPDAKKAADWLFTADVNKKPGGCKHTHTRVRTEQSHQRNLTTHRRGASGGGA